MKKVISVLMVLFAAVCLLQAQVVIDYSDYARHSNTSLKMVLQDSKTFDPISFATVYLVPQNDTIITNFALSGENGLVEIKDIVPGRYTVNAEMIGYKPYRMEHNIRARGWYETDLGVVLMEENPEFIDAATITAVGNAVTVQGDTLTYNASSFRVGENAMLEDLLKKMPGMKVVVIEDLISTGGSSLKAVEAIRNNGCEVVGMVASYTYGFPVAEKAFKDANVQLYTLTNYEAVVSEAVAIGYIDESQVPVLNEWRKDPANWNKD